MSKITKDETGQFITLVRENVAFYHQSSDDYNTSSSLKQTSNNGFELSGAVNSAGKKGGKCRAFSMHKDNPKNARNSACRICTHKAFAGRRNACRIFIRIHIPTNGFGP